MVEHDQVLSEEPPNKMPQNDWRQIGTDHRLTGTNRARPGLREVLAARRAGDTLVNAELDRFARGLQSSADLAELFNALQSTVYRPTSQTGKDAHFAQYGGVARGRVQIPQGNRTRYVSLPAITASSFGSLSRFVQEGTNSSPSERGTR
ncbi:hypothetical protein E3T38_15950 [Cryobacterium sp. Hb1]|nr:hypothetical protein E3T38_15950 [Cryobacterium sp. Hb1]